jgi:hypothetical protein
VLPPVVAGCLLSSATFGQSAYSIAVNTFAPVDTDVFVAEGDGGNARPLFAHPSLERYCARFATNSSAGKPMSSRLSLISSPTISPE